MKTEEERLKGHFQRALSVPGDVPDFDAMWEVAGRRNSSRRIQIRAMAAVIAALSLIGTFLYTRRPAAVDTNTNEITSWNDPTRILIQQSSGSVMGSLSEWNSPTSSLLNRIEFNTKQE